jgi:hypothetical protein
MPKTCGEHVYDDFIEMRPGAAAELEAYLNRVPNQWPTSPSGSHPSSAGSHPSSANTNPSPLSSQTSWSSQASTSFEPSHLSKQSTRVANSNPYSYSWPPRIEPLWLFACVNEGKWTTKMTHLDVNSSKINSDKDFALALGGLYSQVNRKWYKLFKLRGLVSINFVQVGDLRFSHNSITTNSNHSLNFIAIAMQTLVECPAYRSLAASTTSSRMN